MFPMTHIDCSTELFLVPASAPCITAGVKSLLYVLSGWKDVCPPPLHCTDRRNLTLTFTVTCLQLSPDLQISPDLKHNPNPNNNLSLEGTGWIFYCLVCGMLYIGRKEGNILFNDTLNTFYLRLYGIGHMVKDH